LFFDKRRKDKMAKERSDSLALFISNYLKRMLEESYNQFGKSKICQMLKSQNSAVKYAIEAMLYSLSVFLNQEVSQNSVFKRVLVEIGTDAAPELAKRIINGAKQQLQETNAPTEDKKLAAKILDLDPASLQRFLQDFISMEPVERGRVAKQISGLDKAKLEKLIRLPLETLKQFAQMINEVESPAPPALEALQAPQSRGDSEIKFERLESAISAVKAERQKLRKSTKRRLI
jgi:hypothetical protein